MDEDGEFEDRSFELEAAAPPSTLRTDLFGENESDEEEEVLPPAQDAGAAAAQVAAARLEDSEALPAEEEVRPAPFSVSRDLEERALRQDSPAEARTEPAGTQEEDAPGDEAYASESDEDGAAGGASEAEDEDELDEFEALFRGSKKRRRKGQAQEIVMTVETLIANMEVAAELDITANEAGKPAVNKLKMLPQVEDKLSQTLLHRELLNGGILGALKLWVELLPNGSLPNTKVRTSVLKLLHKLPIDLSLEGRKEQLKKSQLGKYVMFYSKLPDETLPNRQLARALVEKWSRPIFEQYREHGQDDELQEREAELAKLRKKRRQEAEQAAPKADEAERRLQPGDAGFRWHARVPAPARLDYLRLPDSAVANGEGEAVPGRAKPKDRMSKKLAAMSRRGSKRGGGSGRGKVSLQGRGLLL